MKCTVNGHFELKFGFKPLGTLTAETKTGQAGTAENGILLKKIFKKLSGDGFQMPIVCSSGIATTVYENLCSNCVGIGTVDLPWQMNVNRSLENNLCVEMFAVDIYLNEASFEFVVSGVVWL